MHNAPTVTYPVGRSSFQAWSLGLLMGLEVLTLVAWGASVDTLRWWHGVVWAGLVITALVLLRSWWRTPASQLAWDGTAWHLTAAHNAWAVQPQLIFDLQTVMLVQLSGSCPAWGRWLWLERAFAPNFWLALRRALHNPRQPVTQALVAPDEPHPGTFS
ncbi:hypothetical protein [Rhodoferax sp.]|uniref:hypothetical protein n=1 Tax=Rhodoferax sp. TaxID=50421 RepID=UPI002626E80F|nr:hypothetical protein [Rhodoferax sp.]MDD2810947.1 hypothetical protein [Rhodoferax sp.]MDD4942458.1 hypothetical protein [Rhodoferax sp.]